jgi:hypothetical protein
MVEARKIFRENGIPETDGDFRIQDWKDLYTRRR